MSISKSDIPQTLYSSTAAVLLVTPLSFNNKRDTRGCSCCHSSRQHSSNIFSSLSTSSSSIGCCLFLFAFYTSMSLGFSLTSSRIIHSLKTSTSPPITASTYGVTYNPRQQYHPNPTTHFIQQSISSSSPSKTQLNVWWFGGSTSEYTSTTDENGNEDSCELVAVRIDRTSPNSRRISAEISIPRPIDDVWAILTDYDQLATHVPNLVESRRINNNSNGGGNNNVWGEDGSIPSTTISQPGDGSYKCRLYQRGAQKIIGFEFGANLVMDMTESIRVSGKRVNKLSTATASTSSSLTTTTTTNADGEMQFSEDRRIGFKCIESQFFSEFDGEWKLQASMDMFTGDPVTIVTYVVDVRPKGPVPVAALEWRIREDVPTNLRAVKKAAVEVGYEGIMAMRLGRRQPLLNTKNSRAADSWTLGETLTNISSSSSTTTTATSSLLGSSRNSQSLQTLSTSSNGRLASAGMDMAQNMQRIVTNVTSKAVATASNRTQPKARLLPVRVKWYDDETMAKYLKKDPS